MSSAVFYFSAIQFSNHQVENSAEVYDGIFRLFLRREALYLEAEVIRLTAGSVADIHGGFDGTPALLADLDIVVDAAYAAKTEEGEVIGTAGHTAAAEYGEDAVVLRYLAHEAGNFYLLALVALRMILHIDEPCTEVVEAYLDGIGFKIVRQLRLFLEEVRVFGLEVDLSPAIDGPDIAADILLTGIAVAAVEDDDIGIAVAVNELVLHVLLIDLEGLRIDGGYDLEYEPAGRQVDVVKVGYFPHTVVFHDDGSGLVLFVELCELFGGEVFRLLDYFGDGPAALYESAGQLLFAFLTEDDEVLVLAGKFVAGEKIFYNAGLTAFQKSEKEVDGNLLWFFCHCYVLLFCSKELFQSFFVQSAADNTEAAGVVSRAFLYAALTGNVVEAEPLAALGVGENSLGAKNDAVSLLVFEGFDDIFQLLSGIFVSGLTAPADEDFIGVMVVMAGAVGVMALMVMMVVMLMAMLVVVVAALAVMTMMLMLVVMVMVAALAVVMVVLMVVVVVAALAVMVMMLMLVGDFFYGEQFAVGEGVHYFFAADVIPGSGDNRSFFVEVTDVVHGFVQLLLADILSAAEDYAVGAGYLVGEEFAEVAGVHLGFAGVNDGDAALDDDFIIADGRDGLLYIGELADAGRLDDDAVGVIGVDDLMKCSLEVADQRAADAAGVYLAHLDTGFLQEATVNADVAEFVFDKNDFIMECFGNELLDERRFAGTEKTGEDVYFCHLDILAFKRDPYIYSVPFIILLRSMSVNLTFIEVSLSLCSFSERNGIILTLWKKLCSDS